VLILSGSVLVSASDFDLMSTAEQMAYRTEQATSVQIPYLVLAGALLLLAVVFAIVRLPKITHSDEATSTSANDTHDSIFKHRNLLLGTIAIFMYVGAEVSIGSFLINFFGESNIAALAPASAAKFVSYYWGFAMI
jgi:FHS family L-fucose permease-like MFS transporter